MRKACGWIRLARRRIHGVLAQGKAVSLLCEGGIASPQQVRQALAAGADAVVVGTAITGIDLQVAAYVKALA